MPFTSIADTMREYKRGKLHSGRGKKGKKGRVVKSKKQALAISLSMARKAGVDVADQQAEAISSARRK